MADRTEMKWTAPMREFDLELSGGGPHALACAAAMPKRVLAIVSGAGLAPYGAEPAASGTPRARLHASGVKPCTWPSAVPMAISDVAAARASDVRMRRMAEGPQSEKVCSSFGSGDGGIGAQAAARAVQPVPLR